MAAAAALPDQGELHDGMRPRARRRRRQGHQDRPTRDRPGHPGQPRVHLARRARGGRAVPGQHEGAAPQATQPVGRRRVEGAAGGQDNIHRLRGRKHNDHELFRDQTQLWLNIVKLKHKVINLKYFMSLDKILEYRNNFKDLKYHEIRKSYGGTVTTEICRGKTHINFQPPYSLDEVNSFEYKNNIQLPEELKIYLTKVSRSIYKNHLEFRIIVYSI